MTSPTFTGRITHPWTRIADGRPEEGEAVLVLTKHGMAVAKWVWVDGSGYKRENWREWEPVAVVGGYGYDVMLESFEQDRRVEIVSHWMALPELPQEG